MQQHFITPKPNEAQAAKELLGGLLNHLLLLRIKNDGSLLIMEAPHILGSGRIRFQTYEPLTETEQTFLRENVPAESYQFNQTEEGE